MKKMNKKGFTLIELLAVIIILGVLMIIAVPSVTEYISSSRKSAYIDTAYGFIDAVRTKVNAAEKLQFFDINTLYLVPVGNTNGVCVAVEKGGKSPFSDFWEYAYVGVTYTGESYNYYFVARDGSNQGINFVSDDEMNKKGGELVVSGTASLANYGVLDTAYGTTSGGKLSPGLLDSNQSTAGDGKYLDDTDKEYRGRVFLSEGTFDPLHFGLEADYSGTGNPIYQAIQDKAWQYPDNATSMTNFNNDDEDGPTGVWDFAEYVEETEANKNIDFIIVVPSDLC